MTTNPVPIPHDGTSNQYVVPMYESERGWGSKIDGYSGPFPSFETATAFREAFNLKHNSDVRAPDWYIAALTPVPFAGQECSYKMEVT